MTLDLVHAAKITWRRIEPADVRTISPLTVGQSVAREGESGYPSEMNLAVFSSDSPDDFASDHWIVHSHAAKIVDAATTYRTSTEEWQL